MRVLIEALFLAVLSAGCSSISGHKVVRNPDGTVYDVKNVKGLPIVVQTPTKALLILTKSRFRATRLAVDAAGNVTRQNLGEMTEATLSDKPILLGPSEVYTIDPRRPAAGTIDYAIELKDQYPTKFQGKLDDKTLAELRQLAKDLAEVALKAAGAPGVAKESGELRIEKSPIETSISLVIVDLVTGEISVRSLS